MRLVDWYAFGFTDNSAIYEGSPLTRFRGSIPIWRDLRLVDHRLVRMDWDTTPRSLQRQPKFKLWVYTPSKALARTSWGIYCEIGRLRMRWSPIAKADWATMDRKKVFIPGGLL